MKKLSHNIFYNIIYNVVNLLFPLIMYIYASRILLADGIGRVAYANNVASYFLNLAALGLPTYGVREIAKSKSKNALNKTFSELFIINLIFTLFATILYFVFLFYIFKTKNILLYIICGMPIFFNAISIDWFYKGKEEFGYITIRNLFIKIIALIATLFFIKNKTDFIIFAFITNFSICANHIFNIFHARKFVGFTYKNLNYIKHIKPLLIFAVTIFLSTAYSKLDITMLGLMKDDTAVGIYSNMHKIIDILITIAISVSAVFLPRLSYLYETNINSFNKLINKGISILAFLTFPMAAGLCLLSYYIVNCLFGFSFSDGYVTLRVFSILLIVKSFGDLLCYQVIVSIKKEKVMLPAYFIGCTINILLNALLIPIFSHVGAAIASIACEIILNVIEFVYISKLISLNISFKFIISCLISTIIMSTPIIYIINHFNNIYNVLISSIILGIFLYIIAMYILIKILKIKLRSL